jgi:hypothetical protein
LLSLAISGCNSKKVETENVRLGGWDYSWMEQVKEDLKNGRVNFFRLLIN